MVADLKLSRTGAPDGGHLLDAVRGTHPGIPCLILMSIDPLGATMAESYGYLFYGKGPIIELVAMIRQAVPRA